MSRRDQYQKLRAKHWTIARIAKKFGVSRQAIQVSLRYDSFRSLRYHGTACRIKIKLKPKTIRPPKDPIKYGPYMRIKSAGDFSKEAEERKTQMRSKYFKSRHYKNN